MDRVRGAKLRLTCSNLLEIKAQYSYFSAQEPDMLPDHCNHRTGRNCSSYALLFRSVQVNSCQNVVNKQTYVISNSWLFT